MPTIGPNGQEYIPKTATSAGNPATGQVPANTPPPLGSAAVSSTSVTSIEQLTLANGMTAGIGLEQLANPILGYNNAGATQAGPYFRSTGQGGPPLRVGVMRSMPGILPMGPLQNSFQGSGAPTSLAQADPFLFGSQASYYLFFLYNPNQITASWSIDPTNLPPLSTAGQPLAPNIAVGQTVSWSLVFDRTYDIFYDPNPQNNRGVLSDVAALYNVMGVFESGGQTPYLVPVQVVFGKTDSGALWGFQGYIVGATITYGIFKHNMIPARCEVDLQMMARYIPSSISATDLPSLQQQQGFISSGTTSSGT
jgi:hypothetical protein